LIRMARSLGMSALKESWQRVFKQEIPDPVLSHIKKALEFS
jgi:hypothetical protein